MLSVHNPDSKTPLGQRWTNVCSEVWPTLIWKNYIGTTSFRPLGQHWANDVGPKMRIYMYVTPSVCKHKRNVVLAKVTCWLITSEKCFLSAFEFLSQGHFLSYFKIHLVMSKNFNFLLLAISIQGPLDSKSAKSDALPLELYPKSYLSRMAKIYVICIISVVKEHKFNHGQADVATTLAYQQISHVHYRWNMKVGPTLDQGWLCDRDRAYHHDHCRRWSNNVLLFWKV